MMEAMKDLMAMEAMENLVAMEAMEKEEDGGTEVSQERVELGLLVGLFSFPFNWFFPRSFQSLMDAT